MKLDGRRQSTNVEDRRGSSVGKVAGGVGIGGIIIALIVTFLGGNPSTVSSITEQLGSQETVSTDYTPTAQEQEFEVFARQILASTEDVWTEVFKKAGMTYQLPKLVLFKGKVQSGCGSATSSVGPFYCSADQCLYLDLDFFNEMEKELGAKGDFAQAYVIAHEVGHHIQNLLGTLNEAHSAMAKMSEAESNKMSVRIELQADFYAGIWGYYENQAFGSLEDGDLEEAINAAQKIGDDYLQKQAGYRQIKSDLFTHGTSAQRMRWLKKGLTTGNLNLGDTFSCSYESL